MAAKFNLYQTVVDSILPMLERGVAPWRKPWDSSSTGTNHINGAMPVNQNLKAYSGINILLLWNSAAANGFSSNVWMTYKNAAAVGGQVKKGSKSTMIVFWSKAVKDAGTPDEKSFGFLKYYNVFNADQIENLPAKFSNTAKPLPVTSSELKKRNEFCDAFAIKTGIKFSENNGNKAFYAPSMDYVTMPAFSKFDTAEHYYSTLWHEFSHATGHKDRLDRNLTGSFGDSNYAFEELVAEMSSAFLCAATGVSLEVREDHAAYLACWIKGIKNDPKALFKACSLASKASNWILDAGGVDYSEDIEAE